jgi:hypothetical protein
VNPTYPHDYRLFFEGDIKPLMVGGQAVNLWAITFLEKGDRSLTIETFGSEDMDLLDEAKVLEFLASAPGWNFIKRGIKDPFDIRVGRATSTSEDNRVLLVEIVKGVKGLDKEEIVASTVEYHGTVYRLLDPIALLKAKAANVRELDQIGPPPRHDAEHLNLIVDCLPHFISAVLKNPNAEEKAPKTVSRLFSTLQHKKTADTLRNAGVDILSLITNEIKTSSIPKIQKACEFQIPRLITQEAQAMAVFCETIGKELTSEGLNHPVFSPSCKRLRLVEKAADEGHAEALELRSAIRTVQKIYGGHDLQASMRKLSTPKTHERDGPVL